MPGVFPDYPAPVVRNTDSGRELLRIVMRGADKEDRAAAA